MFCVLENFLLFFKVAYFELLLISLLKTVTMTET